MIDFLELYDEALHTPSHLLEGVVAMIESIINSREQAFKMRQQRRREREAAMQQNPKLRATEERIQTESDDSNETSGYRSKYAALCAKRHEPCSDEYSFDECSDSEPECDDGVQDSREELFNTATNVTENENVENGDFQMVVNKKNKKRCKNLRIRQK